MSQKPAKFLHGDLMRHVAVMSLSASLGLVAIFLVDFVDLYFIAQLGDPALTAAVGFAGTLLYFALSVRIGLNIACSALSARMIGSGDLEGARRIGTNSLVFGLLVSTAVAAIAWIAAPQLLDMLGATGEAKARAISYLRISLLSMPVATLAMMNAGILRAHGDARRSMMATLAAGGVNAVLDPIFIFGFGWGLEGAAIASVCAMFAMMFTATIPVLRHYGGYTKFDPARFQLDLTPILAICIPAILTNIATPVGNFIVIRVIAPFGDDAVSGLAVMSPDGSADFLCRFRLVRRNRPHCWPEFWCAAL